MKSWRLLPWTAFALTAGFAAVGYGLLAANGAPDLAEQIILGSVFIAYALVGALIASLRRGNRIGWILIAIPALTGVGFTAEQYAVYASSASAPMPAEELAVLLANTLWFPALGLLALGLLLYPTGSLASERWRPVAWLLGASILALSLLFALTPPAEAEGPYANPLAVLPPGAVPVLEATFTLVCLVTLVLAAGSLLVRLRHARGVERQQIKWFLAAATLFGVTIPISLVSEGTALEPIASTLIFPAALATLPVAIGVAILRYRLFDIDLLINRTLVYGALTVVLGGVYAAAVLLLQGLLRPVTGGGTLAVAASTLAVAALFQPARRRIQRFVDRRFYRSRYDLARTVEAFSLRLRSDLSVESLTGELTAAADHTMRPASVSVWLRRNDSGTMGA